MLKNLLTAGTVFAYGMTLVTVYIAGTIVRHFTHPEPPIRF